MATNLRPALDAALADNPFASRFGYGPKPPPPDLSDLAKPAIPKAAPKGDRLALPQVDLSGLAKPAKQPVPLATTLGEGVNTAGRGFVRGALESAGQTLRGLAGQMTIAPQDAREMDRLGLITLDPNKPLEQQVETRPPQELGPYKLGETISGVAQRPDLAPPPGWDQSWTDKIAGAFGSTAPYLAAGATGAGGSLAAGTLLGAWSGAGQAMDDAIAHGATKDQILQASHLGNIPGSTETLPMEVLFERVPLPAMGKFAAVLGHVLATAAAEGGQEGLQQAGQNLVAKWTYDPKRDLMDQVVENAELGAIVGGGAAVVTHAIPGSEPAQEPVQQGPEPLNGEVLPPEAPPPPGAPAGAVERPTIDLTANPPPPAVDLPPGTSGAPPLRIDLNAGERDRVMGNAPRPIDIPTAPGPLLEPEAGALASQQLPPPAALKGLPPPAAAPEASAPSPVVGTTDTSAISDLARPAQPPALPAPTSKSDEIRQNLPKIGEESPVTALPDLSGLARPIKGAGIRRSPAHVTAPSDVARAEAQAVEATPAQAVAGNSKAGHARFRGLPITIQVPVGGTRKGITAEGTPWETPNIAASYGHIKGIKAADGEPLDVMLGPDPSADTVFMIDQVHPETGAYDETKAALGFRTEAEARRAYASMFSDGQHEARVGAVSALPFNEFKVWARSEKSRKVYDRKAVSAVTRQRRRAIQAEPSPVDLADLARPVVQPAAEARPFQSLPEFLVERFGKGWEISRRRDAANPITHKQYKEAEHEYEKVIGVPAYSEAHLAMMREHEKESASAKGIHSDQGFARSEGDAVRQGSEHSGRGVQQTPSGSPSEQQTGHRGRVGTAEAKAEAPQVVREPRAKGVETFKAGKKGRATAREDALAIIKQVAGDDVAVNFAHKIFPGAVGSVGMSKWGAAATDEAAGSANKLDRIINISLNPEFETDNTAYHEAYHLIEDLKTKAERDLIRRELPRLRAMVAKDMGLSAEEVASVAPSEIEAQAFAAYAQGKDKGMHAGIRAFFAKVLKIIRRIRNMMQGLGFKTVDDYYDAGLRGEVQARGLENEPATGERFSIGRRPRRDPTAFFDTPEDRIRLRRFLQVASLGMLRRGVNSTLTRRKLQDRAISMRDMQDAITAAGGTISEDTDLYLAESLYYGRTGEKIFDLRTRYVDPLVTKMAGYGIDRADLDEFLYALHAAERNAAIRQRDPTNTEGSGMSDTEARTILQRRMTGNQARRYLDLADDVKRIVRRSRETLFNAGLIDQDTLDAWEHAYANYVPLRGWEGEDIGEGLRSGRGFDVRGPEAQAATGRHSRADSPLAYTIMQAQQSIIRAEKNRVAQMLGRLAVRYPNKQVWEVNKVELKKRINPSTGLVEEYWLNPQAQPKENIVIAKSRGKATYITVHHEGLLNAMRMSGAESMGRLLAGVGRFTRVVASLYTTFDPDFVLRNLSRDTQESMLHLSEHKRKGLRRAVLRDMPAAATGMFRYLRGDEGYAHVWLRHAREFAQSGGKISFFNQESLEDQKKALDRALSAQSPITALEHGRPDKAALAAFHAVGGFIEDINGSVENAIRLSIFVNLRRAGISQSQAASAAREITVNFNRKGEWSSAINVLYLFSNATVQGGFRQAQFAKRAPRTFMKAALAMAVLGAGADWLNYILAGEDPKDGMNFWDKVPDYDKQRNFIIMQPGTGKYLFKFPMLYGYNIWPTLGGSISAAVRHGAGAGNGMEPLDAALNVLTSTVNAYSPLDLATGLQALVPTAFSPLVEIWRNKDWKGSPITPPKSDDKQPNADLFYRGVNPVSKEVAKELERFTTYDARKPAAIDISPEWIDHIWGTYMGGAGQFWVNRIGGNIYKIMQGEPVDTKDIPFLRTFRGEVGDYVNTNIYYNLSDDVLRINDLLQAARSDAERQAVRDRYPVEASVAGDFVAADRILGKLRRVRKQTEGDPNLSADARKSDVQKVETEMAGARDRARAAWETARKRLREAAPQPQAN